jgi:hypothetical protein
MSDTAGLALVVVALYLSECVVWARHGAVVVVAPWLMGPRMRVLSRLGTARGALTLLNPLPPFGRVYVVEPWPFSVSPDGVVAARSFALAHEPRPLETGRSLSWDEVTAVAVVDKDVHVAGAPFARCSSARHARAAALVLTSIAGATQERSRVINELLEAHLDPDDARGRAHSHERISVPLIVGASAVFVTLFGLVPGVVSVTGVAHWPLLLASVYAWVVVCAVSMYVAHRNLTPEARGERWMHTLLMVPAPTMAMRGNDKLGRHLMAGLHPLAVALGVLVGSERDDVVGRALRDLQTPRAGRPEGAIERAFRDSALAKAKALAHKYGIDVNAAFAAPPLRAGRCAWCPRCRLPYRQQGVCSDCGVTLRAV